MTLAELVAAVEAVGYRARSSGAPEAQSEHLGVRLSAAARADGSGRGVGDDPGLQFDGWEWVALALTAPVVLWAGWPFHRAALANARHGGASMDTLISLGTLAALAWSAAVLVGGVAAHTYFEVAAVITTLVLLGRYLELRARRRAGEAIRALLELGAKGARVLRDGEEVLVPIDELRGRRPLRRSSR